MILDYSYNQYSRKFDLSYIEDNGQKQLLSFNVNRFKSFYSTPSGKYMNWDGSKCDVKWVEKPSKFDIKTFITELDTKYQDLITKKKFPKVYAFDIETLADENGEFSEPEYAANPISTISICSPDLNTIVLGTLQLSQSEKDALDKNFSQYIDDTAYFKELDMKKPYVKYICFESEEQMLKYFLSNIVAKIPILTGWNCIKYDWQYIVNRIKNYYPSLSIKSSSCTYKVNNKSYKDRFGNKMILPMPEHTLILDMLEIVEDNASTDIISKESMKLDVVAYEALKRNKIEYDGSLDDLYKSDYGKYVYYNSVDSLLVELLNYKLKLLDPIYVQSEYCKEKISSCFSKIALTEALVFNDFYEHGLKIVPEVKDNVRSTLIGAYVKKPIPGLHNYVCCNDFASLYPSSIRSCNLSFENYVGEFWNEKELEKYKNDPINYVVIGPAVYENDEHKSDKKSIGRLVCTLLDEKALEKYRKDKNYFVSVNGCVYKNDKDYAFRRIQAQLKDKRDKGKYLCKKLDAVIMSDLDHLKKDINNTYSEDIVNNLKNLGYEITCTNDIRKLSDTELVTFRKIIQNEIVYMNANQLAIKSLMNSMYGGSSHVSFYWYNMNLANDITGEARNIIHIMEHHIPDFVAKNWVNLTDVHKKLGIEVDPVAAANVLKNAYFVPKEVDPDTYNAPSFVLPIYGDTDSCNSLTTIKIQKENKELVKTFEEWFNDNDISEKYITLNGSELIKTTDKVLNYNKDGNLEYQSVNYIMRHKVSKPKWCLKTKSGKEVIVTGDHSLIVFRDNKKIEVKPKDILPTDKILIVKD